MANYESVIESVELTIAASSSKAFEALFAPIVREEQIHLRQVKKTKSTITYEMSGSVGEFYGTSSHWDVILIELPYLVVEPCIILETSRHKEEENDYRHKIVPKKATKELMAMFEVIHTNIADGRISVSHESNAPEVTLEWEDIVYSSKPNKGESGVSMPITVYVRSFLKIKATSKGYKLEIDGKEIPQRKEDKTKDEALKIVQAWIHYYRAISPKN